jgi:hypothetical protein
MFGIYNLKKVREKILREIYNKPEMLTEIEFANRGELPKKVWVELACCDLTIDAKTEYKIVTHDKAFRIEFDTDGGIIFYLQYSFGYKLYKRAVDNNFRTDRTWELDFDWSEIN